MSEATFPNDFGACCICRKEGATVRNFVMLQLLSPIPGNGWGCMVCGLPPNGATAVVCDSCVSQEPLPEVRDVIVGHAAAKLRMPRCELGDEVFDHDRSKHPELAER